MGIYQVYTWEFRLVPVTGVTLSEDKTEPVSLVGCITEQLSGSSKRFIGDCLATLLCGVGIIGKVRSQYEH